MARRVCSSLINSHQEEWEGIPRSVPGLTTFIRRPQMADAVQFADSRTAYDDLSQSTKDRIGDYALNHSQHWSRKKANPGHPLLEEPRVSLSPVQAGLYRMKEVLMGDSSSRNRTRSGSIDWSRSMNLVVVK